MTIKEVSDLIVEVEYSQLSRTLKDKLAKALKELTLIKVEREQSKKIKELND